MADINLYPLLLTASLHQKVWGGRRLESEMHKTLPDEGSYGEAWELHDSATVANGKLAGKTLADLLTVYGTDLIGVDNDPSDGLPLLAKILNAEAWLSVQVHPNDEQAAALENQPRGKTEAWIVLAAEDDAKLVIGVKPGTTRESMAQAIRENTLEALLVFADVMAGDVLYIPANTIHAIGPGILLYEIQQSSNTTYRLYDWGRMGLDGNPRELHIDKGVQVSNIESLPDITHPAGDRAIVVDSPYFRTIRHILPGGESLELETKGRFQSLTCTDGTFTITHGESTVTLQKGQTVMIPASLGVYFLVGNGTMLRSFQP
ncbi:MAG: type I phosphomannose isomerase catalytic subunit [Aggregatilineales bacterium]